MHTSRFSPSRTHSYGVLQIWRPTNVHSITIERSEERKSKHTKFSKSNNQGLGHSGKCGTKTPKNQNCQVGSVNWAGNWEWRTGNWEVGSGCAHGPNRVTTTANTMISSKQYRHPKAIGTLLKQRGEWCKGHCNAY
jgi:hypothetical protein